jgi:ribosomal protein S18 acetylase RimI-like enzyme
MNRNELADKLEYHEEAGNAQVAKNIGGEFVERGDVMLIYSRPEFEIGLNFACRIRSDEARIEQLIDDACEWFHARDVTPHFRISPLTRPIDLAQILERRKFVCNERETQMVLEGADTEPPTNPRVAIEPAASDALEKGAAIQHHAFGGIGHPSPTIIKMARASFESGMSSPYIARLDGELVGAGLLTNWAGVFGIYGVATVASARGQGVATAMVRKMIYDVQTRGNTPICLQAQTKSSEQRWYERMGFRVVYNRTGWKKQ